MKEATLHPEGARYIEKRDGGIVLLLSFVTCGLYLAYWYYKIYEEIEALSGETPTGHSFWLDFVLNIVTCTLYGIWVDYQISASLYSLQKQAGYPMPQDTGMVAVILDISAWITGFITNIISSAVHQDQLNKTVRHIRETQASVQGEATE